MLAGFGGQPHYKDILAGISCSELRGVRILAVLYVEIEEKDSQGGSRPDSRVQHEQENSTASTFDRIGAGLDATNSVILSSWSSFQKHQRRLQDVHVTLA